MLIGVFDLINIIIFLQDITVNIEKYSYYNFPFKKHSHSDIYINIFIGKLYLNLITLVKILLLYLFILIICS